MEELMSQAHDYGEAEENDIRRDDHLEREFGVTGREFQRGSDSYAEMSGLRLEMMRKSFADSSEDRARRLAAEDVLAGREAELFNERMLKSIAERGMAERTKEDDRVALEDRDIVRFRAASFGQVATSALEGQTATVGEEEQENVPDEEHPMGADASGGVKA